jgi:hypothetical protein
MMWVFEGFPVGEKAPGGCLRVDNNLEGAHTRGVGGEKMAKRKTRTVTLPAHWVKCSGEAHQPGVDVDHCGVCMPYWESYPVPCVGAACRHCAEGTPLTTEKFKEHLK